MYTIIRDDSMVKSGERPFINQVTAFALTSKLNTIRNCTPAETSD